MQESLLLKQKIGVKNQLKTLTLDLLLNKSKERMVIGWKSKHFGRVFGFCQWLPYKKKLTIGNQNIEVSFAF